MLVYIFSIITILLLSMFIIFVIIRANEFVKNRDNDSAKLASLEKKLDKILDILDRDKRE